MEVLAPAGLAAADSIPIRRLRWRHGNAALWLGVPLGLIAASVVIVPMLGVLPNPAIQHLDESRLPPVLWGGTWAHPLGTDLLGHDLLASMFYGGRLTLIIGVLGAAVAVVPGTIVGLLAGYRRGWADAVISRVIDAQLALPFVLIAIAIISNRGHSLAILILVLALTGWAPCARVIRAATLSIRTRPFTLSLRAAGASGTGIVVRHVLPNLASTVVALTTLMIGSAILVESALSFLDLGVVPPQITWGSVLASGQQWVSQAWWVAAFPGIAITVVVLLTNLLGDALLTQLDPRKRR